MARVRPSGGVLGPPITVSGTSASGMFSIVEANLDKIDELRITKYARYTSTFTPTTSSFLNQ